MLGDWLISHGELCVDLYYRSSGSSGSQYFITSLSQFDELASRATEWAQKSAAGGWLTVKREPQLTIRGIANEELIQRALAEISDGTYFLVSPPVLFPHSLRD
jgi:hypothetical protein